MNRPDQLSIFPSYNARALSAEEIGRFFVAPEQFETLCQPDHSLVLGPRGSGKTTMLKMLTAPAIKSWLRQSHADGFELPFVGVYVPADQLWTRQLGTSEAATGQGELEKTLVRAAVSTNVLFSFLDAIDGVVDGELDANIEQTLVRQLVSDWQLGSAVPSLFGLRKALMHRMYEIRKTAARQSLVAGTGIQHVPVLPDFMYLHFLDQLGAAVDSCAHILGLDPNKRWAICFDEIEIVPEWMRAELLSLFRSSDQRFLFKVTGSPFESIYSQSFSPTASQPWHDVTVIKLWYTHSWEPARFCARLAQSVLQRIAAEPTSPRKVFGISPTVGIESPKERYAPSGSFWHFLRNEAKQDATLAKHLRNRGIDIENPRRVSVKERDEFLRKIHPVLLLRQEYRKQKKTELRTRRQTSYYGGIPSIFELSDGNPRWMIGMLREMIQKAHPRTGVVADEAQARVIARTSKRFKALLGILPGSVAIVRGQELALVSVLEKIGRFFSDKLLKGDIPLDPVGSFRVDLGTQAPLVDLIKLAVSQGALIYCDDDWKSLPATPVGRRFRISFLLAPSLKLPLRLYDATWLSECLGTTVRSKARHGGAAVVDQRELFSVVPE